jgi:uncharacterized protein (DUF952 family)
MIFHIVARTAFEAARAAGVYRADTLETEGFIHCSSREQVVPTANRFFRGRKGLVLLAIDPGRVKAEIRYEAGKDVAELFPHIYGPLDLDAVVGVSALEPSPEGTFI